MLNTLKCILKKNIFLKKILESFLGKGSFVIFSMVFSFVCTRLYGVEIFGKYTYAYTIVSLLMIIAKAGLDNGLIYHIPKHGIKHISLSFIINLIVSIVIIVIMLFYTDNRTLKLMLPSIWLLSMEQIFFGIYRAAGKIKEYYFINGFLSLLIRISLLILFYYIFGAFIKSVIFSVYISFIASIVLYFVSNKDKISKIQFDKEFLKYSFPLVIAAVMGIIMDKIDIIMIGNIIDKKSVGVYRIAVQLANITSFILIIFNTVFAPQISSYYHQGKMEKLRRTYEKSTRVLGFIALLAIVILILGRKYILLVFDSEIIEGQVVLVYRAAGQFINTAVGSVWYMLAMTGRPKLQMYGNLAACSINIILNVILIPKYGINGAAFASMVSIGFVNILGYILVSKKLRVKAYGII